MEHPAVVAELAYALDSGSSPGFRVGVQVPSTALKKSKTNPVYFVGGFAITVYFD